MSKSILALQNLCLKNNQRVIFQVLRACSDSAATKTSSPTIKYSSAATPQPPSDPVGPGALKTGDYKNPEYFCYNDVSYYDLEAEMVSHRLPQPDAENEQY